VTILATPVSTPRESRVVGYRSVLGAPGVARVLGGTLLGRLPAAMAPVGILILLAHDGVVRAGTLSGAQSLAACLGQPLLARAANHHGHRVVLAAATLVSSTAFAVLAVRGTRSATATAVLLVTSGAAAPPLQSCLRARWSTLVAPAARPTAHALDTAGTELLYVIAPVAAAALAALSPVALFATAAGAGVLGTAVASAAVPAAGPRPRGSAMLRHHALRPLLRAYTAVGFGVGALQVTALRTGLRSHDAALAGQGAAMLCATSFISSLLYGARRPADRHLPAAAASFAASLTVLPFTAHHPIGVLTTAAAAGVWFAPLQAAGQLHAQDRVPAGGRAEAAGWLIAALGAGEAAGIAVAAVTRLPPSVWPPLCAATALAVLLAARGQFPGPAPASQPRSIAPQLPAPRTVPDEVPHG
jgi:hypothetical protein